GCGGVHHRDRIGRVLLLPVGIGLGGTVRAAVAATVECHDAAVPGEVGNLHLPVARVDDRPGRHQQDGRLALAVDLVVAADAVALDEALLVRVPGPRLLGRYRACDRDRHRVLSSSQASIQSSSSRCPWSIPDIRSSMIPSLNAYTSVT